MTKRSIVSTTTFPNFCPYLLKTTKYTFNEKEKSGLGIQENRKGAYI